MKIQNPIKLIIKFIGGGVIKFPTKYLRWIDVEPINCSDDSSDEDYTLIGVFKKFKEALIKENPDITELKNAIVPDAISFPAKEVTEPRIVKDTILNIAILGTRYLYLYKNEPKENEIFIEPNNISGYFIYTSNEYIIKSTTIDGQLYYYITTEQVD